MAARRFVSSSLVTLSQFIFLGTASIALFASHARASLLDGELSSPGSIHTLLTKDKNIVVELGFEYAHFDLPSISNIVVENPSTSTAASGPVYGTVNADYPDTLAQTLRFQAMLDEASKWTIALKTYLPLNGIAQVDTGWVYQPEFVLYRAEAQRPRILLDSGVNLNDDWRVALGVDVSFSVTANANVFLQSGSGTVSDQRITAKVKPGFVPQAAVGFKDWMLTVRGENRANFDLTTQAGARVFSSLSAGVDMSYTSSSAIFYQPWDFEFTGKQTVSSAFDVKYGVSYQLWSGYAARAAVVEMDNASACPAGAPASCTSQFSNGVAPASKGRNIFVPEAGLVLHSGVDTWELDWQFKDSIFQDLPTGQGNYLDPPRHDFLLGFTHPTAAGWSWNIHGSLSRLNSETVVKSDPNAIGGPGYTVDGWTYGGGFSVAIPLKD